METVSTVKVKTIPDFGNSECGCGHPAHEHNYQPGTVFMGTGSCKLCDCDGFHALRNPIAERLSKLPAKYSTILTRMLDELEHADNKYPDDRMSPKELKCSLATVKCEFEELKRETKRKTKRPVLMEKEAIQLLTMSFKFNRDVVFAEEP